MESEEFSGEVTTEETAWDIMNTTTINGTGNATVGNDTEEYDPYYPYYYDLSVFTKFRVAGRLYKISGILFFIFGVIGNCLAVAVVMRKNMRRTSTSVFIVALAIFDTMALAGLITGMIVAQYETERSNDGACIAYYFLWSFGGMASAWTVVAITFERVIVVCFPLKAPSLTSRKKVFLAEALIAFFLFLHNIHFFWTTKLQGVCINNEQDFEAFFKNWAIYDSTMSAYLPLILIFIFNMIIIVMMRRAGNMQKAMSNKSSSQNEKNGTGASGTKKKGGVDTSTQVTIMLLTISTTFFLFTAPLAVLQILVTYEIDMRSNPISQYIDIVLTLQVLLMLLMINHSINIILYSLTGKKFRMEMLRMFGIKTKDARSSLYSQTRTTSAGGTSMKIAATAVSISTVSTGKTTNGNT